MRIIILLLFILSVPTFSKAAEAGKKFPHFSLTTANSTTISSEAYSGKILYLDIWASWCGPCRKSLPWVGELKKKYGERAFDVLAVSVDVQQEEAESFLKSLELFELPVAFDPDGHIPENLHISAMPSSFLIGKDGAIISEYEGFRDSDKREIEEKIEELLRDK